jgi:hypothetical protein
MNRLPLTITFTLAGTVPFVLLSVAVSMHLFPDTKLVMELLLTYATVIVSFLGGIHLGVALTQQSDTRGITNMLIIESIWPSLIAWGMLFMAPVHIQLLALTLLYSLMWAIDSLLYNNNLIPQWFFNLRCIITPIVVVSLYVAYFGLIS